MSDAVVYRSVPGFPEYEVGTDGTVWSSSTKRARNRGARIRLRQTVDRDGYRQVRMHHAEGTKRHIRRVHALVLGAFVGPRPRGLVCRHKNGDPSDNRLENLAWGTHQENCNDCAMHGRRVTGDKHWNARISERQFFDVLRIRKTGASLREIASLVGISKAQACRITSGAHYMWRSLRPVGVEP